MIEHEHRTLIGEDLPVTVYFDFQPEESATLEYPGCAAEVTINAVEVENHNMDVDNHDILDCLSKSCIDELKEEIAEALM
jgi:hypothetical protein